MKQRIMTGVMLIFIVAVIMFFAQTPVLPFVIALGSVIAVFEIMRCIGMKKAYPFAIPLYALAASFPFAFYGTWVFECYRKTRICQAFGTIRCYFDD